MEKKDLRILKTQASLFRALITLLKEKEFEQIKISEICSKSMINRSTFYDHYNDKNELLIAFMAEQKNEIEELINKEDNKNNKIINILKIITNYIEDNIELYSSLAKIKNNSIIKDTLIEIIINSIDNTDKTLFYAAGGVNYIVKYLKEDNYNKDKIIKDLTKLIQI